MVIYNCKEDNNIIREENKKMNKEVNINEEPVRACNLCAGVCWNCLASEACGVWNETSMTVPVIYNGWIAGSEPY